MTNPILLGADNLIFEGGGGGGGGREGTGKQGRYFNSSQTAVHDI